MVVSTIGLDLAKNVVQVDGVDPSGRVVDRSGREQAQPTECQRRQSLIRRTGPSRIPSVRVDGPTASNVPPWGP